MPNKAIIAKEERFLLIHHCLKKNGKVLPLEILDFVYSKLRAVDRGQYDKKSLRSVVYNDLKEMFEKGLVHRNQFTKKGMDLVNFSDAELSLQKAINTRTEYFLPGFSDSVVGANLITDLGGAFVAPNRLVPWEIREMGEDKKLEKNSLHFVFFNNRACIDVSVGNEFLPITLIVSGYSGKLPDLSETIKKFGKRYGFLFLPFTYLQEINRDGLVGHAVFRIHTVKDKRVLDLGSPHGTRRLVESDLDQYRDMGRTIALEDGPLLLRDRWKILVREQWEEIEVGQSAAGNPFPSPATFKLGKFRFRVV